MHLILLGLHPQCSQDGVDGRDIAQDDQEDREEAIPGGGITAYVTEQLHELRVRGHLIRSRFRDKAYEHATDNKRYRKTDRACRVCSRQARARELRNPGEAVAGPDLWGISPVPRSRREDIIKATAVSTAVATMNNANTTNYYLNRAVPVPSSLQA